MHPTPPGAFLSTHHASSPSNCFKNSCPANQVTLARAYWRALARVDHRGQDRRNSVDDDWMPIATKKRLRRTAVKQPRCATRLTQRDRTAALVDYVFASAVGVSHAACDLASSSGANVIVVVRPNSAIANRREFSDARKHCARRDRSTCSLLPSQAQRCKHAQVTAARRMSLRHARE